MHLTNGTIRCLAMVVVVGMCSSLASASVIPVGIGADANAMGAWQGRVEYRGMGNIVAADVEYAVYAPGQFDLSFSSADPSGGTAYVYAYQIYNDLSPHPTQFGTKGTVTLFSVEVYDNLVSNIGSVATTGDVPAAPASIIPLTARWEFTGTGQIVYPQTSEILIFTSPQGPIDRLASLSGSAGGAGTTLLPSPMIPEPTSLLLIGVGLAAAMARRER